MTKYEQEISTLCTVSNKQRASELGMIRFNLYDISSNMYDASIEEVDADSVEVYFGELPDTRFNKRYPKYMEEESNGAIEVNIISCRKEDGNPMFYFITRVSLRNGKTVSINKQFEGNGYKYINDMKAYIIDNYNDWCENNKPSIDACNRLNVMQLHNKDNIIRYEIYKKMRYDCLKKQEELWTVTFGGNLNRCWGPGTDYESCIKYD